MSKTGKINALFDEWVNAFEFKTFMKDGIVNEELYENILFIMKDVNNAVDNGIDDMRIDVQTSMNSGKTWFNIARWICALLDGMGYEQLNQDIKYKYNNSWHSFQHEQLCRAAIVNIKKEAGVKCVEDNLIAKYACEQKEYLFKEITICDPAIIVVCGVNIFDCAKLILGNITPIDKARPQFEMAKDWEIGTVKLNGKDIPIVQFRHPSTGCDAEKSYNDMLKIREYVS